MPPKLVQRGTLVQLAVENRREKGDKPLAAMRRGFAAALVVVCYAIVAERDREYLDSGRDFPNQLDYARWWNMSERKARREWAAFRDAFPDERSPERIARLVWQQHRPQLAEGGKAELLALSLPADLGTA